MHSASNQSSSRRLTLVYISALSVIALMSIIGQVLDQNALVEQSSDARIINIAGRQRMLSQKIAKAALALQLATTATERQKRQEELREASQLWERSHRGLQRGDTTLGLPGNNSAAVTTLFAKIEPLHQSILTASKQILTLIEPPPGQPATLPGANLTPFIQSILSQDGAFLEGMNQITFQYDKEATERTETLKRVELLLLALTLLALILEARLVFRPVVRKIQQTMSALVRAEVLQAALDELEKRRQMSEETSRRVLSVVAELNATATQQAHGSQEQAAALSQINHFLQELTVAAGNIRNKAEIIAHASQAVTSSTQHLETTTGLVVQTGQRGQAAVEEAIQSNLQMGELYAHLVETLQGLQAQSSQIKEVLTLMRSLSDETHLLGLNAAIEAAGAGEQGVRFGVVAGEVRALADRSVAASKKISAILEEVERRISQAVLAAHSGLEHTQNAATVVEESGKVISELLVSIEKSVAEVKEIEQAAHTMSQLTQEIDNATSHQHSATRQTAGALQEVNSVAHQSASSSLQVSNTARNLENLSNDLIESLVA